VSVSWGGRDPGHDLGNLEEDYKEIFGARPQYSVIGALDFPTIPLVLGPSPQTGVILVKMIRMRPYKVLKGLTRP
jgi:hypothetical protein